MEFNKIYKLYYKSLIGFAINRGVNFYDAEDLVQETFIRFLVYGNYDKNLGLEINYLQKILINLMILNYHNKRKMYYIDYDIDISGDENILTYDFEKEERMDLIKDIVYNLPPNFRYIMISYFYFGIQQKDIAEEINMNINTLKSRIYFGKRYIKNIITKKNNKIIFNDEKYLNYLKKQRATSIIWRKNNPERVKKYQEEYKLKYSLKNKKDKNYNI